MPHNPYSDLPEKSFWRPSVAQKSAFDLVDLYTKKFEIGRTDRVVTAGSCFAQHISRKLAGSGFTFCDYEVAPPFLKKEDHRLFNYGVYSARYGNLYTARQLLQLMDRVYGDFSPKDDMWEHQGGYVDAFRPAIEPTPFKSRDELEHSRSSHFQSCRRVFEESDLFIFTLGLTEAWVSRIDGAVYPLCPGTFAGEFSGNSYAFVNFDFMEVYGDLKTFIDKARTINPGLRFLLTVSPVPLVATYSGDHVLAATTYSKSVLRAVAGKLSSDLAYVDYFPSFEVISGIQSRSAFYEPNLRDVTRHGVDYVMSHFFAQHAAAPLKNANSGTKPEGLSDVDLICEELLLEKES